MTKDKISLFNVCFMSVFLYSSLFSITTLNLLLSLNQESSIFIIILGTLLGLILLKVFFKINDYHKELSFFGKLNKLFPKWIKHLIQIILIICTFYIASFSIYNTSLFINNGLLRDVNITPIIILLLVPINYVSSKGIETLLRSCGILIYFSIILIVLSIIGLINYSTPSNLYPIVFNSNSIISPIYYLSITIFPIFMMLIIPKKQIYQQEKYNKYFRLTYIITNIYILVNFVIVISSLGTSFAALLKYPEINAYQKIYLLNFIERLEDFLSYKILLDLFISISLCFIYINEHLKHIKAIKKDKFFIYLLDLFTIIFVLYIKPITMSVFILFVGIFLLIHIIIFFAIKITNH